MITPKKGLLTTKKAFFIPIYYYLGFIKKNIFIGFLTKNPLFNLR